MERKTGIIWRIAIVVFLQLFLLAGLFAAEIAKKPEENDKNGREPITRFQITKEHHLLMQQIIESLRDITGILRRVAKSDTDLQEPKELDAQLDAMTKKVQDLSERHQRLMKAVDDLSKETSNKKKIEEDRDLNANP